MFLTTTNYIDLDAVEERLSEAQDQYATLIEFLTEAEIGEICSKMVETDEHLAVALGSLVEHMELNEFLVKRVTAKGEVSKIKDRKTRQLRAFQTTGLSKARRREIARKVVKAKNANPSGVRRGVRKQKRAMKKRAAMGLT